MGVRGGGRSGARIDFAIRVQYTLARRFVRAVVSVGVVNVGCNLSDQAPRGKYTDGKPSQVEAAAEHVV